MAAALDPAPAAASTSAFSAASNALASSFQNLLVSTGLTSSASSPSSPTSASALDLSSPTAAVAALSVVEQNRLARFRRLLDDDTCDLAALRALAWSGGVPAAVRRPVWQLLLAYAPLNRDRRAATLERRRAEYAGFVRQYYMVDSQARTETEQGILRQVSACVGGLYRVRSLDVYLRVLFSRFSPDSSRCAAHALGHSIFSPTNYSKGMDSRVFADLPAPRFCLLYLTVLG